MLPVTVEEVREMQVTSTLPVGLRRVALGNVSVKDLMRAEPAGMGLRRPLAGFALALTGIM